MCRYVSISYVVNHDICHFILFRPYLRSISNKMIYITQLIYIKEGQEHIFDQFEDVAIPIIGKYNGKLLLRVRPGETAFIETWIDKPYEIHLVEFASEQDFKNFMVD